MKSPIKKLLLITLIVGTSPSSCRATIPNNNNNRQMGVDPNLAFFVQNLKEANERVLQEREQRIQEQKSHTEQRIQEQKRHAEQRLQEQKRHAEQRLQEQKSHIEQGFQIQLGKKEAKIQRMQSDEEALKMKHKCEKRDRYIKRSKQRQKYVVGKLNLQGRNHLEAIAKKEKEAGELGGASAVVGTVGTAALGVAITCATGGIATAVGAVLGAYSLALGTGAIVTNKKKVPDNRETIEELQQKARELYPSSSDEDDSKDEGNNNGA